MTAAMYLKKYRLRRILTELALMFAVTGGLGLMIEAYDGFHVMANWFQAHHDATEYLILSGVVGTSLLIFAISRTIQAHRLIAEVRRYEAWIEELRKQGDEPGSYIEKLRTLFNSAGDTLLMLDWKLNIVAVNDAVRSVLGYDPVELLGKSALIFVDKEFKEQVLRRLPDFTSSGKSDLLDRPIEITVYGRGRRPIPVEYLAKSVTIHGKRYVVITMRDQTGKKKMLAQNEEVQRRYQFAVQSAPVGMFFFRHEDADLIFDDCNRAASDILGFDCKKLVGKPALNAWPNLEKMGMDERFKEVLSSGRPWEGELTYPRDRNGVEGIFRVWVHRPRMGEVAVLFTDETERISTNQALKDRSEDLEKAVKHLTGREGRMKELKDRIEELEKENAELKEKR